LVYPELSGGASQGRSNELAEIKETEASLSAKLDDLLKEAGVDASLMESLGDSIRNFEGAAKGIAPTVDAMESTKKYSDEMVQAAAQMESLNSLYKVQYDSAERQTQMSDAVAENTERLKDQMESLATNLSSLNGVYGGMLSAMSSKA